MACTNIYDKKQDLVDTIGTLNLFGTCQDDLEFTDKEEQERERNFIRQQKEREEELKRLEEIRIQQEKDDHEFAMQEQRRLTRSQRRERSLYKTKASRGRGQWLSETMYDVPSVIKGRGRVPPDELRKDVSFFSKEALLKDQIQQFASGDLHNNNLQKNYWQSLATAEDPTNGDLHDIQKSNWQSLATAEDPANGDLHDIQKSNWHSLAIAEDPDIDPSPSDTSFSSEQFEDAFSTPQSASPQFFQSAPNSSRNSPAPTPSPHLEVPVSTPPRFRKPRGSRLAAKFSNMNLDDDKDETQNRLPVEEQTDQFAVLGSSAAPLEPWRFRQGNRSGGMSFNDLRPSQRILSNGILRPEELYSPECRRSRGCDGFTFKDDDFPTL